MGGEALRLVDENVGKRGNGRGISLLICPAVAN